MRRFKSDITFGKTKDRDRGSALYKSGFLSAVLLALAGVSQAQMVSTPPAAPPAEDQSLTWHGITLYGIVDIALQYDTHAAPISDYFMGGSADIVQKNSNNSVFGVTPNNLSQSRVGLQGKEPLPFMDWSAVFKLETFFNPQAGTISDALKSLTQNNGKPLTAQNTNIDSSVAGQAFQQSFAGFSSPTFGTITFGRQNTIFADAVSKYDPMAASQAFSVIGLSGTSAGGGDTEDRRLDDSLKYTGNFDLVHLGLMYKFANGSAQAYRDGGGSGEAYNAIETQLGFDYAGLSVDAYYIYIKDAISASAISVADYPLLGGLGYSSSNSVAGTVSDNKTYAIAALYNFGSTLPLKVYGAWEHIEFDNPSIPLPAGYNDEGGYVLAFVNNTAYAKSSKTLQVYWAGAKYSVLPNFDVTAAYYGYKQDAYATGKDLNCSSVVSGACSGNLNAASLVADYRLTKRFDVFGGAMWSNVTHGLANGYLETTNINPTIGVRYSF
ncbi:MAG: porin [Steroidobacteraceae bacterium]